jgi:hypothetical protein
MALLKLVGMVLITIALFVILIGLIGLALALIGLPGKLLWLGVSAGFLAVVGCVVYSVGRRRGARYFEVSRLK